MSGYWQEQPPQTQYRCRLDNQRWRTFVLTSNDVDELRFNFKTTHNHGHAHNSTNLANNNTWVRDWFFIYWNLNSVEGRSPTLAASASPPRVDSAHETAHKRARNLLYTSPRLEWSLRRCRSYESLRNRTTRLFNPAPPTATRHTKLTSELTSTVSPYLVITHSSIENFCDLLVSELVEEIENGVTTLSPAANLPCCAFYAYTAATRSLEYALLHLSNVRALIAPVLFIYVLLKLGVRAQ